MGFPGTGKIWMNGGLVEWKDATIHIASHVIHYGSGVFEGARCYGTSKGSACFRLDDHLERFVHSAKIYRMAYPLDLALALDYTCQICNAVDHAHRHGVLHRDLRPSNVLIPETGPLKVADFGTSRFLEIAAHGTTVIGSPPYMAPEQFLGKAVFASDIYSLGITMFQILTGELPYDATSPAEFDRVKRGELVAGPRLKNPKIPKAIDDIVLKAIAPEIGQRYQRASDLLDDVIAARTPRRRRRVASGVSAFERRAHRRAGRSRADSAVRCRGRSL